MELSTAEQSVLVQDALNVAKLLEYYYRRDVEYVDRLHSGTPEEYTALIQLIRQHSSPPEDGHGNPVLRPDTLRVDTETVIWTAISRLHAKMIEDRDQDNAMDVQEGGDPSKWASQGEWYEDWRKFLPPAHIATGVDVPSPVFRRRMQSDPV